HGPIARSVPAEPGGLQHQRRSGDRGSRPGVLPGAVSSVLYGLQHRGDFACLSVVRGPRPGLTAGAREGDTETRRHEARPTSDEGACRARSMKARRPRASRGGLGLESVTTEERRQERALPFPLSRSLVSLSGTAVPLATLSPAAFERAFPRREFLRGV